MTKQHVLFDSTFVQRKIHFWDFPSDPEVKTPHF